MNKYVFLLTLLSTNISFAQQHRQDREHHPNRGDKPKASFSFWFNSKPMHFAMPFDKYFIFNIEEDLKTSLEKTKGLQNQFRQESKLLDIQIDYLVKELEILLQQQQNGVDNSQKIIDNYTKLHQLNVQHYDMLMQHTEAMRDIFQESHKEYKKTISQKIEQSANDPGIIVVDLLERYNRLKQKK